jgi:hypothetical protein
MGEQRMEVTIYKSSPFQQKALALEFYVMMRKSITRLTDT